MNSHPHSRKRPLTAEEAELWTFAMREAKELRRRGRGAQRAEPQAAAQPEDAAPEAGKQPPLRKSAKAVAPAAPPARPAAPAPPPLARFDDRARRKLTRDPELIDSRLDLHGMRQREAHSVLAGFLLSCVARGHRNVLIITGKGAPADDSLASRDFYGSERGVLRRLVPQWLAEPELRSFVISYTTASARHGGEGALYVQLRKTPARG